MSRELKYKRVVLSKKREIGGVDQVTIDFGWINALDIQPSLDKIRASYPGWSVIHYHAIKPEQAYKY
jgi:hypothetical protein